MGADIVVVTALVAFGGGVSCAAVLYVIHKILPNNWMRGIAACASVIHVVILHYTNYWQTQPIRVLFPTIFMAYGVFLCAETHGLGKKKIWIAWILGVLAVLWNTESGISCLIAFALYMLTEQWKKYRWYDRDIWKYYLFSVLFVMTAIAASLGILNIYNIVCGGEIIFGVAFYPLFNSEYVNGTLRYDMVWGNHAWLYVLVLFLLVLCWGNYHTRPVMKSQS